MILRGTTPRALTWSGYLAVLSLGALLLPLVPSLADEPVYLRVRLEDEKERKDKPRVIRVEDVKEVKKDKPAYVRVEDDKKSEDEVSRTEAEVKKAQAQMQEAMERLRAAQRRLAELHSKREPGKAANVLGEKMQGMTIIIQDASGKEIQKIKVPSGADLEPKIRGALELHLPKALELRKDNILRKGGPDEAGKKADMEKKEGERREVIIRRGEAGAPPPERMADLEKRLDMLMRELEALRREIRRGGPGEGPRGGGGSGGSIRPPEAPRAPLPPAPRRPGEGAAPALPGLPGSPGRPPERRKGEDEKGRVEKPDAAASFFFGLFRQ